MRYIEEYGDLFKVGPQFYLCHCISADFALGKGIAVEFNKRYHMKSKLFARCVSNGAYPKAILIDKVFNLVTKGKYWEKPTYDTLRGALEDMERQAKENNVHAIAMPMIGTGLDRLQWPIVLRIIKETFKDDDILIKVVKLRSGSNSSGVKLTSKYSWGLPGSGLL